MVDIELLGAVAGAVIGLFFLLAVKKRQGSGGKGMVRQARHDRDVAYKR